ncbi:Protein TPX2 [Hibiscus syriacus]|uniref:Protein TPX2 n=1 Tax=Hibiscus syriacus TaxID=106335 RepID=A0A6A2XW51_HIBSY|nr:Protein TPX2 [Hibiscus syriacus]
MNGSSITTAATVIDALYEFSAPCFFDFIKEESEDEARTAELWFETALTYAPSPFMARIKAGSRSVHVESLCNFSEEDQMHKASESSDATAPNSNLEDKTQDELVSDKVKEEVKPIEAMVETNQIVTEIINDDNKDKENEGTVCAKENGSVLSEKTHLNVPCDEEKSKSAEQVETEACTPKPLMVSQKKLVSYKKHQTAKKIASMIRNPSVSKPKTSKAGTPNLALENQAIKRQKLDGGRSRQVVSLLLPPVPQILNVKPHNLLHKSKLGLTSSSSNLSSSTAKTVDRKVYVREKAAPFVSMAEMMKKFQSSTRDLSLPHSSSLNDNNAATIQMPPLKLTRPKEPEFETAQRMRPVRVKSTAELEEEMMAKIPKFKARPLNKKIFEAPPLPSIPKSTPKPPEFQEFHLETMARASKNAETSSVASTEVTRQNDQWKPHLMEPKAPVLQTSLRARPTKVKSSIEIEQEELEKAPKFKARPLNKKIFESKGELGIFFNAKKQVTIPQEFHFATHERVPPRASVFDLFDKLSLNSVSSHDPIPRKTFLNPFHLHTEERGDEKEKKFVMEVIEKHFEEERVRVPKANPYPYTTDYPEIPQKPEPKQCTKPEPFQLESLVRHEEEMKREMEERKRKEKEEAQMRVFKAQPVLKEDPIPVLEKSRKPLTQVQQFDLHVNHRAVERAEFDQKIKEKEMIYKRYREESEAAIMIREEKALKQLRRTMVPHARPLPKFDHPFCPQKSSKVTTKPKSPRLRVLQRIERKKTIGSLTAPTSSLATLMR